MTNDERDDTNDSQALTGGDITMYRALVARTSHKMDHISSLRQCKYAVRKRIGRCLVGKHWQQSGELEAYSDADRGGDKVTRRSVPAGVIMRGGQCLKLWTKKQQVVSLSTAESELYAAVKTASEVWEFRACNADLEGEKQ